MLQDDIDIKPEDVQILRNQDALAGFFAKLGYDTNKRVVQNPQHLGISNQTLLDQIKRFERISENGLLRVYLIELSSVTVANTLQLSRSFKEMSGFFILVLTSDYERIDFVFLDRVIPLGKKVEVTTRPRFALRPRSLTVNRNNLDTVSRRVLRRLTFTEGDEFAQYEKIRSAYTMADWAEDFFNNRALFSDYFLIHRLKDDPVWMEKAEYSHMVLKNKLKPFSSQWHNTEEQEFLNEFVEPVLTELGFEFEKVPKTSAEEVKPHYILLSKTDKKKVGAMLSYRWGRHLDAKDYTRDKINPEENPSQAVVTVLEREEVPWVIVTNGKAWRLYSAKAHSRATNYYEIDLEETIALDDPSEAFRYYWLLFREDAFIPRSYVIEGEERKRSFLDKLFYCSQEYSKELEEKLKKRVFEEVFPFFAEGFIQTIGGKEKLLELSEDERDAICRDVFSATLTILYRLLFLLYAESRDLLPGKEVRGYYDKSLTRLKKEIGRKAGNTADDVESKLKSSYTKSNTELYDRLMELAEIIDKGKSSLNVPAYNGGLFLTELTEDGDTREAEIARFLTRYKIPDIYLAMGLDKLARVEDSKKFELVPIDYKSLGVRQLGSIYEGLLEFNVRIAPEKMAVVKGKRTEQVVPYVEAVEKELRILTNGRGSEKREYTLPRGAVYIENDKKERKATGSYYTPDYIVRYIVENTVGPVLEEKFKEITPKLRTLRPEHVAMEEAKEIIDDLFDINVLDPAMGSGHFLVETVDYITDKMLHFLNGFPNNPVQLELQRTRDAIMEEMNRQGVSIDQNKLIDVSLMKRYVLKRCVYGVDLNPMAVELAKVSLWLDCFTLGAPLSYLDHHLKCGNSLIGASLKEAEKEIESGQMTIWATSKFGGVKRASEHMIHVGELSDITTKMMEESKKGYCKATREIEPYKRLLDIYTSRWFSNSPILTGTGKKKKEFDCALDFLRSDELSEWLKETSETKNLDEDKQQIIKNALTDVAIKRFFHWELEFPEIFCGKSEEEKGFDVVIGNPPWGGILSESDKIFASQYSQDIIQDKYNTYLIMIALSRVLLREAGYLGMITPNTYLRRATFKKTRLFLLKNCILQQLIDLGENVFEDAIVPSALLISRLYEGDVPQDYVIACKDLSSIASTDQRKIKLFGEENKIFIQKSLFIRVLHNKFILDPKLLNFLLKLESRGVAYGNVVENTTKGIQTGANDIFILTKERKDAYEIEEEVCKKVLMGKDFYRYGIDYDDLFILNISRQMNLNKYPNLRGYLLEKKDILEKRDFVKKGIIKWYDTVMYKDQDFFKKERIILRRTGDSLIATYDDGGYYNVNAVYNILISKKCLIKYHYLLSIISSRLSDFYYKGLMQEEGRTFAEIQKANLENLPVRSIQFTTPSSRRFELLKEAKILYTKFDFSKLLKLIDHCLPKDASGDFITDKEKSDVVHDVLAFLAEQMIAMNKEKQTTMSRFLDWVESRFHVDLEELSGRTMLIKYYEHDFEKFHYVLKKNKNHFYNILDEKVKQDLLKEFQKSLGTIEPLLDKIKSADDLIDRIVYRLYGLTDEEIEIVENIGG